MTVASSETRDAARGAYDDFRAGLGEPPTRVRIVSGAQLVREGGWRETRVADAAVARRAGVSG